MARHAHLVGTWPGRDPEHAMDAALRRLAPYLERMTDGETGDRRWWVGPPIDLFRVNPDLELAHVGASTKYEDREQWQLKTDRQADPDNVRLYYAHAFRRSYPSFRMLRERHDRPDMRFQVGIPAPLDITVYAFGGAAFADPSLEAAWTAASAREIAEIHAEAGDDVVFQIETVYGLVTIADQPDAEQQQAAQRVAQSLLAVVEQSPEGSRFGFHLCVGDFNHTAQGHPRDARPLVLVANALAAQWPQGRILDYIHVPFAAAADPPIQDAAFYAPLADLELPESCRFIAGFLHETLDLDAHANLLERIEQLTGREVDVAAACGLGRRATPEESFEQMQAAAALIDR